MSDIECLAKELGRICSKYGCTLKGGTTDGSIIVEEAAKTEFEVFKKFEKNAFIKHR